MKHLKKAAIAAMALTALAAAPSASATTLEVGAVAQNRAVTEHLTLRAGTSLTKEDTFGNVLNTCRKSTVHNETERTFTAAGTGSISGAVRALTFEECTREPVVVHRPGTLSVQWIRGTTNGTVFSTGAELTESTPLGTLTCTTNNTDLGELTGGANILDVNAVLSCTLVGSVRYTGRYTVTSPTELGVVE